MFVSKCLLLLVMLLLLVLVLILVAMRLLCFRIRHPRFFLGAK
jgi:hypothetical protein